MIYLYSDIITQAGGIETYLHALATKLHDEGIPFRVAVSEQEHCPMLDDLEADGIDVYRQPQVPGDRWHVRRRLLMLWLWWQLEPGDWVYCIRQPVPALYQELVRLVHNRGAKIAASWMFSPKFLVPDPPHYDSFCQAVEETDAVISVSECTKHQFQEEYGYSGPVDVVPYHNLPFFEEPVPLPVGPPWRIGYMGRLSTTHKNLDTLLHAFQDLSTTESKVELHLFGDGSDRQELERLTKHLGVSQSVTFHGAYDHRRDLSDIAAYCHFFVYTSRFEGGPCFTLLELLQAGRFVVASSVGGIPDIYDGHPEAGLLIDNYDSSSCILAGLKTALQRIRRGAVDRHEVRNRYVGSFDMEVAHQKWKEALGLASLTPKLC
jgi:glycosyltransferase involved in cell wall biosynthesis